MSEGKGGWGLGAGVGEEVGYYVDEVEESIHVNEQDYRCFSLVLYSACSTVMYVYSVRTKLILYPP